jgi:FKBP12-rapamycin complex-associated protein
MFMHMYGRDLAEAFEWLQRYQMSKDTTELHQAWEYYFLVRDRDTSSAVDFIRRGVSMPLSLTSAISPTLQVFRSLSNRLPNIKTIEMQHVSPKLMAVRDLSLIVPGSYANQSLCGRARTHNTRTRRHLRGTYAG